MNERPILFSGPMVRAILEGRKTQTRRVLKPQLVEGVRSVYKVGTDKKTGRYIFNMRGPCGGAVYGIPDKHGFASELIPKYTAGDTLWVREAWRTMSKYDAVAPRDLPRGDIIGFDAEHQTEPNDGYRGKGRPSIHMPRWASRITLKVTDVKVERLQDISEADAIAEGVECFDQGCSVEGLRGLYDYPESAFAALWESINGEASWDANPWVVAYTFERIV